LSSGRKQLIAEGRGRGDRYKNKSTANEELHAAVKFLNDLLNSGIFFVEIALSIDLSGVSITGKLVTGISV
jgi:hypothetical protein